MPTLVVVVPPLLATIIYGSLTQHGAPTDNKSEGRHCYPFLNIFYLYAARINGCGVHPNLKL